MKIPIAIILLPFVDLTVLTAEDEFCKLRYELNDLLDETCFVNVDTVVNLMQLCSEGERGFGPVTEDNWNTITGIDGINDAADRLCPIIKASGKLDTIVDKGKEFLSGLCPGIQTPKDGGGGDGGGDGDSKGDIGDSDIGDSDIGDSKGDSKGDSDDGDSDDGDVVIPSEPQRSIPPPAIKKVSSNQTPSVTKVDTGISTTNVTSDDKKKSQEKQAEKEAEKGTTTKQDEPSKPFSPAAKTAFVVVPVAVAITIGLLVFIQYRRS